jgi:lysophospholipase L1-like esterase
MNDVKELVRKVLIKDGARIKLLGDSITHGVGGTGFMQNGEHIINEFSRNPSGYCWAKLFKEYMQKEKGAVVINNACTGTRIEFVRDNFDTLVDDEDDLVICTIGTNNRHIYHHEGTRPSREEMWERVYTALSGLVERFQQSGKNYILVANIPASKINERDGADFYRVLHMDDINAIYKEAREKYGFAFISMYDLFMNYCGGNMDKVASYLGDGLHPNDKGYDVMFELIKDALGV